MGKNKPAAVLISDVHYNLKTLPLADAAMLMAITKANELDVPLIVAGDLHDTKANMRAECVSAMIKTFKLVYNECYILRGNHDQVSEKSREHSLDFLNEVGQKVFVIDNNEHSEMLGVWLIPYHHDPAKLRAYLKTIPKHSTLIMHQGITGSNSGDYIQDHSAVTVDDVAGMRVLSGHYHNRQTIKLPDGGQWDYIGNPYTLTYGEANDPPKGYQVLYNDGSLKFVPTNLRRHIKIETRVGYALPSPNVECNDLVWVRYSGSRGDLSSITKDSVKAELLLPSDFKLELVPDDVVTQAPVEVMSNHDLMDYLINNANLTLTQRDRLLVTWKNMIKAAE